MDTQIEAHLPLITSRIVFAPRVFLPPPTITSRMEFPFINIEPRDDSPTPERARTPGRSRTPGRTGTPGPDGTLGRARTPGRIGTPAREVIYPKRVGPVTFNTDKYEDEDEESLSSLSDESHDGTSEDEEDEAKRVISSKDMIPKPKGEVGRPGGGGYTLFKMLGWNQKTYDNVHVSNVEHMKRYTSHQSKALVVKIAREKLDTTKSYRGQSKKKIEQLIETVSYFSKLQSSKKLTKFYFPGAK